MIIHKHPTLDSFIFLLFPWKIREMELESLKERHSVMARGRCIGLETRTGWGSPADILAQAWREIEEVGGGEKETGVSTMKPAYVTSSLRAWPCRATIIVFVFQGCTFSCCLKISPQQNVLLLKINSIGQWVMRRRVSNWMVKIWFFYYMRGPSKMNSVISTQITL